MQSLFLHMVGLTFFLIIFAVAVYFAFKALGMERLFLSMFQGIWDCINPFHLWHRRNVGSSFISGWREVLAFNRFKKGLILDGLHRRISLKESWRHCCFTGVTGSYKSTTIMHSNLYSLDACSITILDVKGDLYTQCSKQLEQRGYTVLKLDLDKNIGVSYNPLLKVGDDPLELAKLVDALVGSSKASNSTDGNAVFWQENSKELLEILGHVLVRQSIAEQDSTYCNLPNLLALLQKFGQSGEHLHGIVRKYADESYQLRWISFCSGSNEKTIDGFVTTAKSSLRFTQSPSVKSLLSPAEDSLDFSLFRKQKTALFISVGSSSFEFNSAIITLLFGQLISFFTSELPKEDDLPVFLLIDEAGHLPIPQLPTAINIARAFKISISLFLQSTSQLNIYGDSGAKTILEGINTKVFFTSGLGLSSCDYLERVLGKARYVSYDKQGNRRVLQENVLNSAEIRTSESLIILQGSHRAVRCKPVPFFKRMHYRRYAKLEPVVVPEREVIDVPILDLSPYQMKRKKKPQGGKPCGKQ